MSVISAQICTGKLSKPANRWGWFRNPFEDTNLNELDLSLHTPLKSTPLKFKIDEKISAKDFLKHGFNPLNPTKIISHGFTDTGTRFCKDFIDGMKNFYPIK